MTTPSRPQADEPQWTPEDILAELDEVSEDGVQSDGPCRWCLYDIEGERHAADCLVSIVAASLSPPSPSEQDGSPTLDAITLALRQYADPQNWSHGYSGRGEPYVDNNVWHDGDGWELAAAALAAQPKAPSTTPECPICDYGIQASCTCPTPDEAEESLGELEKYLTKDFSDRVSYCVVCQETALHGAAVVHLPDCKVATLRAALSRGAGT